MSKSKYHIIQTAMHVVFDLEPIVEYLKTVCNVVVVPIDKAYDFEYNEEVHRVSNYGFGGEHETVDDIDIIEEIKSFVEDAKLDNSKTLLLHGVESYRTMGNSPFTSIQKVKIRCKVI